MPSTPAQLARQRRIESVLALAAPLLDLMLSADERVSRAIGGEDEYYPIRSGGESFELPDSGSGPAPDA